MSSYVWASGPVQQVLCARLAAVDAARPVRSVGSLELATRVCNRTDTLFIDRTTLETLTLEQLEAIECPIVAVCDERVPTAIDWFQAYPVVSHVMSMSMLEHTMLDDHLSNVLATLAADRPRLLDWLDTTIAGRRIRLTHASRRIARLERMTEFLVGHGSSARTVERLRDVAEELLTNAFYDAPVAAGALPGPVPRTYDIALPDECACDLAYGCSDELAIVHVRDPFGSLSRRRLLEVLGRCAATNMSVQVDETMGGAGLGMWRIFANATFVAISVLQERHTEILVGIAKRTSTTRRPFAFHFFFNETPKRRRWLLAKEDTSMPSGIDRSVMLKTESET